MNAHLAFDLSVSFFVRFHNTLSPALILRNSCLLNMRITECLFARVVLAIILPIRRSECCAVTS